MRDPMLATLALAILAALLFPASGALRESVQLASNIAIFVLFLVNGMRIARSDILKGLSNLRFFGPLFVFVFGAMALTGWGMEAIASTALPPAIALGFLYLGVLPSTVQSATSYTTLSNGNAALSVIGAALINLAGVVISVPIFALLSGGEAGSIGWEAAARIGFVLVLPFLIGQALQGYTRDWVISRRARIVWLDRAVIAIAVYVAFASAIDEGLADALALGDWAAVIALALGWLVFASLAAWWASGLLGCAYADRIAFLFAGSQKSLAIGAPLAAILFAPNIAGFVIVPLLVYHLAQLLLAAPLAARFAARFDERELA